MSRRPPIGLPALRLGALLVSPALLATPALAAEPVTPPAMYPPDTWTGRAAANVRVLDKLDAHVDTLTIPAGQTGSYKSVTIAVRSCLEHPPGLPPDSSAYLTVQDGHAGDKPFAGWMFSAEPFIAVFESPVFAVQLTSCGGSEVAPAAPPLLPPPSIVPASPDATAPADSGPNPIYPSGTPAPDGTPPPVPADGNPPPSD